MKELMLRGFRVLPAHLSLASQKAMLEEIERVCALAPPFSPLTAWGKPMSVAMTSAGKYGWYSDRHGYRYVERHPSGAEWPAIPDSVLEVWRAVSGVSRGPDCCLINRYGAKARMGLHQDKDEADFGFPVVSISLGDPGLFRVGGVLRTDPTESVWLESGTVVVMGGEARLAFHGIDRIRFGGSMLVAGGGRINLTLRVVD